MARPYFRKDTNTWYVLHKKEKIKVGRSERAAKHLAQKIDLEEAEGKVGLYKDRDKNIALFLQEVIDYKKNVRGLRRKTIVRYQEFTNNFLNYLNEHHPSLKNLSQLNLSIFESYIRYRKAAPFNKNGMPVKKEQKRRKKDANLKIGASDITVKHEIQYLKSALNYAVKNKDASKRYLLENPLDYIEPIRVRDEKPKRPLTKEEVEIFLSYLKNKNTTLYEIYFTLLTTGMRLGELKHLEWSDVDFKRRIITLKEKTVTYADGSKQLWSPKTQNGKREIPIHDKLLGILKKRKKKQKVKTSFVFAGKKGRILKRHLRSEMIQVMKAIGINDFTRVHDLRRTFISFMAMEGVPRETTMDIVGHVDEDTYELYRETTRKHRQDSINKLNF